MRNLYLGRPPVARVLVLQSNPDTRQLVVQLVEDHSSSFEVVADTGDIDQARQWIESSAFDLLITDFGSGNDDPEPPDVTAAAAWAGYVSDKPLSGTIFLTSESATAEFMAAVTSAKPLAYIQLAEGLFDSHAENVLHMALSSCDNSRQESGESSLLAAAARELGTIIITVDGQSNVIRNCNRAAEETFGQGEQALGDKLWWEMLGTSTQAANPLHYAVEAGVKVALPPTALQTPDRGEIIVSGWVIPQREFPHNRTLLILRPMCNSAVISLAGEISENDMIAILGVDQFAFGAAWCIEDSRRLMMDIRSSLLEIVRSEDLVSLPLENCVALVLQDIGVEESLDVTNAFLSHLRSVPKHYGPKVADLRFSVGLAQRKNSKSPLQTLVAANNALLCAQFVAEPGRIKIADQRDSSLLCGTNFNTDGAFAEDTQGSDYASFLTQLTSMPLSGEKPEGAVANFIEIVLQQPGVCKLGIFRKFKDGSFRYLAAGERTEAGFRPVSEGDIPAAFLSEAGNGKMGFLNESLGALHRDKTAIQPLIFRQIILGYIALEYDESAVSASGRFTFDAGALHFLAGFLPGLLEGPDAPDIDREDVRAATPLDREIEGYVVDNMEGAVDQASFLAKVDMPVAIIGARGTGKMYIAKIVHQESGGADGMVVQVDCREFRNREEAITRIGKALEQSEGKTLVFKSPQLMAPDAQLKLAKQLSSRTLADVKPARYLPRAKYVALFPDSLDRLVVHAGLTERLASVFSGYPINIPPLKDRKQAVLRWAHKILSQESAELDRPIKGFTPDAEQAMLSHEWSGNISEMRQCIVGALEKTDKEWITPVDLGIFKGITAQGSSDTPDPVPFLSALETELAEEGEYVSTTLEDLDVALGEAVNSVALEQVNTPLGAWLEDDLVLAVVDRYQGDQRLAAEFLHTKPRNISRWMPKILARQEERNASLVWKAPRRLIGEWVRETPHMSEPPLESLLNMLVSHVVLQCGEASTATRAKIMGVSVPTYQKRLRQALDRSETGSD